MRLLGFFGKKPEKVEETEQHKWLRLYTEMGKRVVADMAVFHVNDFKKAIDVAENVEYSPEHILGAITIRSSLAVPEGFAAFFQGDIFLGMFKI